MKRTMLILNLIAAAVFAFLAVAAAAAHATHAYSTYHGLVANHVIVEHPTYTNGEPFDVLASLRQIGAAGAWFSVLGFGAAGACVINGLVFFSSRKQDERPS
jgi:hypothetical protein